MFDKLLFLLTLLWKSTSLANFSNALAFTLYFIRTSLWLREIPIRKVAAFPQAVPTCQGFPLHSLILQEIILNNNFLFYLTLLQRPFYLIHTKVHERPVSQISKTLWSLYKTLDKQWFVANAKLWKGVTKNRGILELVEAVGMRCGVILETVESLNNYRFQLQFGMREHSDRYQTIVHYVCHYHALNNAEDCIRRYFIKQFTFFLILQKRNERVFF